MKYKKITDHKPQKRNPFLDDLFEVKSKRQNILVGNAEHVIVNRNTGEVEGHTAFMKYKEVDPNQFVKIFTSQVSAFYELENNSIKVFAYVMRNMKPNIDQIYLNPDDMKLTIGYKSRNPVVTGISVLIEKKFIARTPLKHWYFINPTIFFNGDRISFINSYKKKQKPDQKEYREISNSNASLPDESFDHSEGVHA